MDIMLRDAITSRVYHLYSDICRKYNLPLEHWMASRLVELTRQEVEYGCLIEKNDLVNTREKSPTVKMLDFTS